MDRNMTSKERIALEIIFAAMGESTINRTMEAYRDMARRLPKLEALYAQVNAILQRRAEVGYAPYQICYFQAGDRYHRYEDFPTSLSKTTIRNALIKSGFWQLSGRNR